MKKIKTELSELKKLRPLNLLALFLAGMVNAFGVTVFLAPVKLYDSGISGTAMLLSQVSGVSLSLFLIVLNLPLFLYGLKRQGIRFTFYALYTVAVYSLWAWLITDVLPIDVSMASPLAGSDLLLCALFGGMISGLGSGLAIRFGGAMDGIEVMAVIFAKRLGVSVGTFVMGYNALLYIRDRDLYPLQLVLRDILITQKTMLANIDPSQGAEVVEWAARRAYLAEAMKYSVIFIASAPLLIAYPFVQKYFVKGVMIGSVKE